MGDEMKNTLFLAQRHAQKVELAHERQHNQFDKPSDDRGRSSGARKEEAPWIFDPDVIH